MSHSYLDELDDQANELIQRDQEDPNILNGLSYLVGSVLAARYPMIEVDGEMKKVAEGELGCKMIPGEHYEKIAEELTLFLANVLQSWLDAGSERDVTMEELGPVIEEHVRGWSTACDR